MVFVRKDSPIKTLTDLRKARCFGTSSATFAFSRARENWYNLDLFKAELVTRACSVL
jgi:hypothetical protein